MCNEIVCLNKASTEDSGVQEVAVHARYCGEGLGLFIEIQSGKILVVCHELPPLLRQSPYRDSLKQTPSNRPGNYLLDEVEVSKIIKELL